MGIKSVYGKVGTWRGSFSNFDFFVGKRIFFETNLKAEVDKLDKSCVSEMWLKAANCRLCGNTKEKAKYPSFDSFH